MNVYTTNTLKIYSLLLLLLNYFVLNSQQHNGDLYWAISDSFSLINIDSCKKYVNLSKKQYLDEKKWSDVIKCEGSLGVISYNQNKLDSFEYYLLNSKKLADEYLDSFDIMKATVYNNIGYLERSKYNYNKSNFYFKKALEIATLHDKKLLPTIYLNIAGNLNKKGNYTESIYYLKEAKNISEKYLNKGSSRIVSLYNSIGHIYTKLGKYKDAEENLNEAYRLSLLHNSTFYKNQTIQILFRLGELYHRINDINKIQNTLNKLKNYNNIFTNVHRAKVKLLEFYVSNKNNIKAHCLEEAIKHLKKDSISNSLLISDYYRKLSLLYKDLLKVNQSKTALENAFKFNLDAKIEFHLNNVKNLLLKLNLNLSIYNNSSLDYKNLKKSLKQLRLQNSTASHKDFWANENLEIYDEIIYSLIKMGKDSLAFSFAEENKSNLLIQSLNDIDAKSYADIPEELIQRERELRANLQFYKKQKLDLESSKDIDTTSLLKYTEKSAELDLNLANLIDSIETKFPEYYEIKYNEKDLKLEDIQDLLNTNEAFVEYFIGKKRNYVFTVTKDSLFIDSLSNITKHKNEFDKYYDAVSDPNIKLNKLDLYASKIYNLAFKKVEDRLNDKISSLIIVPDDLLNNLPFEQIINDTGSIIGDKYTIHYQYSGRLWRLLKNRKIKTKKYDFLGFAFNMKEAQFQKDRGCSSMQTGNLLCSGNEITSIANTLSDKKTLINLKNKENILQNANKTKIIHLATHSCMDSENTDYSRIFFNDGYITNIDLQLQNFDTDLAVLSACESGYGELVKGEGAMSISKGFFHAGCKSTLVSLWPVDDCSTADFMSYFYKHLKDNKQKDTALALAKKDYLNNAHPNRTHPYYWAGFILVGDNSPVWSKSNTPPYLWIALGLIALIAAVGIYKLNEF